MSRAAIFDMRSVQGGIVVPSTTPADSSGAFAVCRCHRPLSLWLLSTLLYGTIAGAMLHDHPYVAGAVITAVWLAATWRGLHPCHAVEAPSADAVRYGLRSQK
jgi:hypothetical protein